MLIPLAILDTSFGNETLLERSQLFISLLNTLGSLDELLDRNDTVSETDDVLEPFDQPVDRSVEAFVDFACGNFVKELLEVFFGFGFLEVEFVTCFLETSDRLSEFGELEGGAREVLNSRGAC